MTLRYNKIWLTLMENVRNRIMRKRAALMVQSFLSEGYKLVFQSNACEYCALKHKENGNSIRIHCGELGVYVYKNNKLLKVDLV